MDNQLFYSIIFLLGLTNFWLSLLIWDIVVTPWTKAVDDLKKQEDV